MSTAPLQVDVYGESDTELVLMAVVVQTGGELSDEALSPFSKPEYWGVMVGAFAP